MRALRSVALCVLCAACTSSGDATGIDLTIRYDPSLGLDRIAITAMAGLATVADRTVLPVDARPLSATGEEGLLILLPDEIAGQPISVRVDGLVGETVAASGRADVLARSERLVEAVVELGDPGICGDGTLSADSEECDDANDEPGDGCSGTCGVEEGWVCSTADGAASLCTSCDGWDWTTTNFTACGEDGLPAPLAALVLDENGVYTLDTDEGTLTAPGGDAIDIASDEATQSGGPTLRRVSVAGLTIEAGATLRATGGDAVLLAVWGDATVSGDIDVSAQAAVAGPGGGAADVCADVAPEAGGAAGNDVSGGGGGGGAGFGGDGADGGDGQGDQRGDKGHKGEELEGSGSLSPLVGGCAGARGGDANGGANGGARGGAGGAVQLAVRDRLTVGGTLRAAGGGGGGGAAVGGDSGGAGGGGGGTGGALFLEARELHLTSGASLCANGGSGGEGSDGADAGANGISGTCTFERGTPTPLAHDGGDAGRGGAGDGRNGEPGKNGGGAGGAGGGGGGSVGRIRLRSVDALDDDGALLSPDPTG